MEEHTHTTNSKPNAKLTTKKTKSHTTTTYKTIDFPARINIEKEREGSRILQRMYGARNASVDGERERERGITRRTKQLLRSLVSLSLVLSCWGQSSFLMGIRRRLHVYLTLPLFMCTLFPFPLIKSAHYMDILGLTSVGLVGFKIFLPIRFHRVCWTNIIKKSSHKFKTF